MQIEKVKGRVRKAPIIGPLARGAESALFADSRAEIRTAPGSARLMATAGERFLTLGQPNSVFSFACLPSYMNRDFPDIVEKAPGASRVRRRGKTVRRRDVMNKPIMAKATAVWLCRQIPP